MVFLNVPMSWPLKPILPVIRGSFPDHEEGVLHEATTKPGRVVVYLLNLYDVSRETLEACEKLEYPSIEQMQIDGWAVD